MRQLFFAVLTPERLEREAATQDRLHAKYTGFIGNGITYLLTTVAPSECISVTHEEVRAVLYMFYSLKLKEFSNVE
jgi:hypothetical protein